MSRSEDPPRRSASIPLRYAIASATLQRHDMTAAPSPDFVYLASQSPRRRQLLEQIGIRHELLLPGAEEDAEALEAVIDRRIAGRLRAPRHRGQARCRAATPRTPRLAAGADAVLRTRRWRSADRILGKPDDAAHASAMLASLSGRDPPRADGGRHRHAGRPRAERGQRVAGAFRGGRRRSACAPMWLPANPWARPAPMRYRVRPPPGSNTSPAVIRASWACRCSKRLNCCGRPVSLSETGARRGA